METAEYHAVTHCRNGLANGLTGKEGYQCRLALRASRMTERKKRRYARPRKEEGEGSPIEGAEGNGAKGPGRPAGGSKFSGKTITTELKENPRRAGTHGARSFDIVLRAGGSIRYEDYKERGGRNNDLQWDIEHKFVEVK